MLNVLYVAFALALVLLNAFFVATEFAIVRVRRTRVDELVAEGTPRAQAAKKVIADLDAYLSACQFGITIASLALGWIGVTAFAHLIEGWIGAMSAGNALVTHSAALVLSFSLIVTLHIVFGELAPKTLAIERPERTALWVAWPIRAFRILFFPFLWALNGLANLTVRGLGLTPLPEAELGHNEEELRLILGVSKRSGTLSEPHARLLINALDFPRQTVRQIMVPRADIVHLDVSLGFEEIREIARKSGHTRYPLCEGDLDRVVGVLHVKDVFLSEASEWSPRHLREIAREPMLVPESLPVGELLELFRNEHRHLCVVIDEYGGTSGIVTLEDVLEELTGDIQDEFDREAPKFERLPDGRVSIDATFPLDDLEETLGLPGETEEEVDTLGGLVLVKLGRLARSGDTVELDGRKIEVSRVRGRRILRVILHPK